MEKLKATVFECSSRALEKYQRKLFECRCGYPILLETWKNDNCFGSGTVLKDNSLPRFCPNCGKPISLEGIKYNTRYCTSVNTLFRLVSKD